MSSNVRSTQTFDIFEYKNKEFVSGIQNPNAK